MKRLAKIIGVALLCAVPVSGFAAEDYLAESEKTQKLLSSSEELRARLSSMLNIPVSKKEVQPKKDVRKAESQGNHNRGRERVVPSPLSEDEMTPGQRFLARYYKLTGRSYHAEQRKLEKYLEQSEKVISREAAQAEFGVPAGDSTVFETDNQPEIVTDKALSDYEDRSLDCQYLEYVGGRNNKIYVKPGFKTDILLPAGDNLKRVTAGDRQRFEFSTYFDSSESRWHVYVQPYQYDITTNIIISTDRHTFSAQLETSDLLVPYVRWNLPDDVSNGYKEPSVELEVENIHNLNFNYNVAGKRNPKWAPMNVFDDKVKTTYLAFEKDTLNSINPVILAHRDDGRVAIVPYEKCGDTIVIRNVYSVFELRTGRHTLTFRRGR